MNSKIEEAKTAFEDVYHEYVDIMTEEEALERASAVYYKICGEYPDLKNQKNQFGFDWFSEKAMNEIVTGTWSKNHF